MTGLALLRDELAIWQIDDDRSFGRSTSEHEPQLRRRGISAGQHARSLICILASV